MKTTYNVSQIHKHQSSIHGHLGNIPHCQTEPSAIPDWNNCFVDIVIDVWADFKACTRQACLLRSLFDDSRCQTKTGRIRNNTMLAQLEKHGQETHLQNTIPICIDVGCHSVQQPFSVSTILCILCFLSTHDHTFSGQKVTPQNPANINLRQSHPKW